MNSEKGFALIKTLVALILLGMVTVAFFNGLATVSQASVIANNQVAAVSPAQTQIEWIEQADYIYDAIEYSATPMPPGQDYTGYSVSMAGSSGASYPVPLYEPPTVELSPPGLTPILPAIPISEPALAPVPLTQEVRPETSYDIRHQVTLLNDGPGTVSRALLRIALMQSQEPYQTVVSTELGTKNYSLKSDGLGNTFAEFEFSNIAPRREMAVIVTYRVMAKQMAIGRLNPYEALPVTRFLESEPWIESDAREIKALAEKLTKDNETPYQKARAIYDWVGDNLSYSGYCANDRGALFALHQRAGDCTEFSHLMIALCRAAGIPARFVEGLVYRGDTLAELKHDWLEVYLADMGWVPVDPTFGSVKAVRDRYFAQIGSDRFLVTTGSPSTIARWFPPFHYFEYRYWCNTKLAKLSHDENWLVRQAN